MTGKYDGKELQRNPGITEDRFVAYKLPSIVNGKRVYPRGHDAQKK
jgi:alpha-D-ribose 1-methylphosphonate 5-triphosphate synthase subunit PhnH